MKIVPHRCDLLNQTGATKKIAPTAPARCAQLQAHWCDERRAVAELLYMAL